MPHSNIACGDQYSGIQNSKLLFCALKVGDSLHYKVGDGLHYRT